MDALISVLLILAGIAIGLPVLAGSTIFWILIFTSISTPPPSRESQILEEGAYQ